MLLSIVQQGKWFFVVSDETGRMITKGFFIKQFDHKRRQIMKLKGIVMAVITALLVNSVAMGAEKTLKLAMYTYPPISYHENDDWGYCYNLVKTIFEAKGFQVEPSLYPVIRAIVQTEELKTDAICVINPFNSPNLSLATYPNARLTYSFWVRKNSTFRYTGIASLKGVNILSIKGYNYTLPGKEYQDFLEDKANEATIRELSGDDPLGRAFQMIDKNRAVTFCLDEPSAMFTLKKLNMVDDFKQAGSLPNVLFGYFGVSKNHPDKESLLQIYNEGHEALYRSGKLASLLKTSGISPWPLEEGKR
jgi:polar amino acid transport system substrate-binding protein